MKRLKFFLPALTLLIVFAISFAGRPAHQNAKATFNGTDFLFIGIPGSDETDPTAYVDQTGLGFDPAVDCPFTTPHTHILCATQTTIIYNNDAPGANPGIYNGLPKVDQTPLSTEIAAAIANDANDLVQPILVWLKDN